MQHVSFCVWLTSLRILSARSVWNLKKERPEKQGVEWWLQECEEGEVGYAGQRVESSR